MKTTFVTYEHTKIGFPHVILKWSYTPEKGHHDFYHTVQGLIRSWTPHSTFRPHYKHCLDRELKRFEEHVAFRYATDISVQG